MKRSVIAFCVFVALAASAAAAQEVRNEVNVQGTGFFTRNTDTTALCVTIRIQPACSLDIVPHQPLDFG